MDSTPDRSAALDAEVSELYRVHAESLRRHAAELASTAEEAREAVQEAFLRYFAERRYGRTIDHPRAWLYQVLRNYLLNSLAAASRREVPTDEIERVAATTDNPERKAARLEHGRAIQERLTPRELECLRLRTEGFSYEEIAVMLQIRSGTVGALLARAQQKLRWPPGKNGKIGLGTASAIRSLFLETLTEPS